MAILVEQRWGTRYRLKGMFLIMKRLGLSHTRTSYTLANADSEKQREFREAISPNLKKLIMWEIAHLLFQDKSMIRDYQAIHSTWFLMGKQRKILTYSKHRGAKLIGYLDYETGEILCQETETYDAVVFQEFLGNVLDNARIHLAKILVPFLERYENLIELV